MEAKEIIQKEEDMMTNLRDLIPKIVDIRLKAQKAVRWLKSQDVELATASEEMLEAIEALYHAETAMGNAHQYLLVSHATITSTCNAERQS